MGGRFTQNKESRHNDGETRDIMVFNSFEAAYCPEFCRFGSFDIKNKITKCLHTKKRGGGGAKWPGLLPHCPVLNHVLVSRSKMLGVGAYFCCNNNETLRHDRSISRAHREKTGAKALKSIRK